MKKLLMIISLILALACLISSCEILGNGPLTDEFLLDGKTPKALYGQSVNKYKNHKNEHIPYSVKAVWYSQSNEIKTTSIELIYDEDSFKYVITETDDNVSISEEILYHDGKMYFEDKNGGKHFYSADRDKTEKFINEHTKVKDITPALPDNIPNSWFDDISFVLSEDGEYYTVTADSKKPKNHPLYKDFYESDVVCKLFFTREGILDKIELENVTIEGEKSNITLYFFWHIDDNIEAPGNKDDYHDKGPFDPDKGHKPGDDNRPVIPEKYSEGLEFTISSDQTYYIVSGIGSCKDSYLNIPPIYENLPVKEIGEGAFSDCLFIKNVAIPEGITHIAREAFFNCRLNGIHIPKTIKSLESHAFINCWTSKVYITDLASWCTIEFEDSCANPMYYGSNLYLNGKLLTDLVIPDNVTNYECAFSGCLSLKTLVIPEHITQIYDWTFSDCTNLTTIVIDKSVISIGYYTLHSCDSLSKIYYTGNETEWSYVFVDTNSRSAVEKSTIYFYTDVAPTTQGNYWRYVDGIPTPWQPEDLEADHTHKPGKTIIENVVEATCGQAGKYEEVKYCSVVGCGQALSRIVKTTSSLGDHNYVNDYCTICGDWYYSDGLEYRLSDDGTYYSVQSPGTCTDQELIIPPVYKGLPVMGIDSYPGFHFWNRITKVVIPEGVTHINDAFAYCRNLKEIIIPTSVTSIGSSAFAGCTSLKNITIPNGVTSIEYEAFYNCSSLENITIPNNVNMISDFAFAGCTSLISIVISENVTYIGDYAFYGCNSLKEIKVDEKNPNYKSIDGNLYSKDGETLMLYAAGKEDVHFAIPEGVTSVKLFEGGTSITSVTIPSSVQEIDYYSFSACTSLKSIIVDENNPNYKSIDGNLYSKDGKVLILYAIGKTDTHFVIPDNVETVANAFYGCTALTGVTIPNSVKYIHSGAFNNCTSLVSITIPNSITSIGQAFQNCTSLTSIILPESITNIEWYAFNNCSSLTNITIPNSVTSIGSYAFYGCNSLTSIVLPESITSIEWGAFEGCNSLADIYYTGTVKTWCDISFGGLMWNGVNLYINDELVTNLVISNDITNIPRYAFAGCTSLTNITFSDSVTSIGHEAFYNCTSLTSITIPDNISTIENFAFRFCFNLKNVFFENAEGWWYCSTSTENYGINIPSADLTNPKQAAECLTHGYSWDNWYRVEN